LPFENKITDLTSLYKKLHFAKEIEMADYMIGIYKNPISLLVSSLSNVVK
jgi:hypothetical protein